VTVPISSFSRDPNFLAIAEALSAPFEAKDIKFKPQMVRNNRALAMAYIDARLIQDRLDGVLGVENWQDNYEILADGSVICRLKLKFGNRWITKTDVGSPSEQPDSGDRLKAAFSDALKRAAVKFGIGRYLYRLPPQWVDYDPEKKQLSQLPRLPAFALPRGKNLDGDVTKAELNGQQTSPTSSSVSPALQVTPAHPKSPGRTAEQPVTAHGLPENGQELYARLRDYESRLAKEKICAPGALIENISRAGVKAGYAANIAEWSGPAILFAVEAAKKFVQSLRQEGAPSQFAA